MAVGSFSNFQFVTIAVAELGGHIHFVDREDVAVFVNKLAPGRFTWRKYPEFIDLGSIGDALRDAKKNKNGALLLGDNTKGWMLTPLGVTWIASLELASLQIATENHSRKKSLGASQGIEAARLRGTQAYQRYLTNSMEQITLQDFYQFARVNEYFQTKAREKRYAIIENAVTGNDDLNELWVRLKQRFSEEMT